MKKNNSLKNFKICVVTSMSEQYYNHIGKYSVLGIQKYWPEEVDLKIYTEDSFNLTTDFRTEVINWNDKCLGNWEDFCRRDSDERCRKFAKKGFSVLQSWIDLQYDFIFWVDADLLTRQPITYEVLDRIITVNQLIGVFDQYYRYNPNHTQEEYLNSQNRTSWHAESGFFVVNTRHPLFCELKNNYKKLYMADSLPEGLPIWYDGAVLMLACKPFLKEVHNLSNFRNTNKSQTPLNNSWMNEYFQHYKANNKTHNKDADFKKFMGLDDE